MNVGQLRAFLASFTDECEIVLEGSIPAKAVYKLESGRGRVMIIPVVAVWRGIDLAGEDLDD